MPSVLFVSNDENDPCTRYRGLAYFDRLRLAGWVPMHLVAEPGWPQRYGILRQAKTCDVVVVLRKTFTSPFRLLLRRASRRLVLDIDDAVYVCDDGRASRTRARRFVSMAQCCDAIFVGNDFLGWEARRHNRQVITLPTSIDPDRYAAFPAKHESEAINLVWIGSRATRRYLESLRPVLEEVARGMPALRLKVIADFNFNVPGLPVINVPWSQSTEVAALASSHIGLAPLPEDAWTRGKCGLKILQYMGAGLPVVASPTGEQKQIIRDGETGILCETRDEWRGAILLLAHDVEKRRRFGAAGRRRVREGYDVSITSMHLERALRALREGEAIMTTA